MYDHIPTIMRPQEILDMALGRATKILKSDKIAFYRTRKTLIARTKATSDLIASTLHGYVAAFPNLDRVDTYERELVEVLVGVDPLRQALGRLSGAERAILERCSSAERHIKHAPNEDEMRDIRRRCVGRVSGLVENIEDALQFLADARAAFHQIPSVTPGDVTVVVAGLPNVGKSSLVAAMTGARPEVAAYAFTTKRIHVGHFLEPGVDELRARRFQLVDTPGLLERAPEERNKIEQQAVLALAHLADVIVYVLDPTETCGYPRTEQESLRAAVARDFEGVPLIDVETKHDLPAPRTTGRVQVSTTTGHGVQQLRQLLVDTAPHDAFAAELARDQLP